MASFYLKNFDILPSFSRFLTNSNFLMKPLALCPSIKRSIAVCQSLDGVSVSSSIGRRNSSTQSVDTGVEQRHTPCLSTIAAARARTSLLKGHQTGHWRSVSTPAATQEDDDTVTITVDSPEDGTRQLKGKVGDTVYAIIEKNKWEIAEYACCAGSGNCGSCHMVLSEEDYNRVTSSISVDEEDVLDMLSNTTDTSRLGCKIKVDKDASGLHCKVVLPPS